MLLSNLKEENVLKVIFKTSIIFYHIEVDEFYIDLLPDQNKSHLQSHHLQQVAIASKLMIAINNSWVSKLVRGLHFRGIT